MILNYLAVSCVTGVAGNTGDTVVTVLAHHVIARSIATKQSQTVQGEEDGVELA